jgi:hypothetical protein
MAVLVGLSGRQDPQPSLPLHSLAVSVAAVG